MSKLAICIPNYNRSEKLEKLLGSVVNQIKKEKLFNQVEVCISDDCSVDKPDAVVNACIEKNPEVLIHYHANERNMGMDYNFLNCVLQSQGEYCWIIGNDDLPEPDALQYILHVLNNQDIDIMVSPFDIYDENDEVCGSLVPVMGEVKDIIQFDTSNSDEYKELIRRAKDGNALFCFLSNTIFRKSDWVKHGNMFNDKMNTIFIQMYMNLQTLQEGCVYSYLPRKLIRNYVDNAVNETFEREYRVLIGLAGVIDYFFKGEENKILKRKIVDPRINSRMWDIEDDSPFKKAVIDITCEKNDLYKQYFIYKKDRPRCLMNKNILLYGAGNMGKVAIKELENIQTKDIIVFDSDENKWGKCLAQYKIHDPKDMLKYYNKINSTIIVANKNSLAEIIEYLLQQEFKNIAIIT